jgi:hypothetical protein
MSIEFEEKFFRECIEALNNFLIYDVIKLFKGWQFFIKKNKNIRIKVS